MVGSRYRFNLYTHCGVEFLHLDNDVWRAVTPLGGGNSPPISIWQGPEILTVVAADRVVLADSAGHRMTFLRFDGNDPGHCA